MHAIAIIGASLGTAWASGINLYAAVATLGCLHRFAGVELPGELAVTAHPAVIILAIVLYCVEFVADKIPYFDSIWDGIHTFIRIPAGAALAYAASSDLGSVTEMILLLVGGGVAFTSHGAKAATRVAINTSPEPFTNSIASTVEDVMAFGMMGLVVTHPIVALLLVVAFVVTAVYLLPKIVRAVCGMLMRVLRWIFPWSERSRDIDPAG